MRLPRIHVDNALAVGLDLDLDAAVGEKLTRVLRLRRGDGVLLFNGDGHEYLGTLEPTGKGRARVSLASRRPGLVEAPLPVTLLQALARGEKMDWILQKATELGVKAIQPIMTERTEVKLDGERTARRMRHWRSVLVAASEQCGRNQVPTLGDPLTLAELEQTRLPDSRVALHPQTPPLAAMGSATVRQGMALAIGPEGGLSPSDLKQLERLGFEQRSLGPRILRTETAGAAALAWLQGQFGDLGAGPSRPEEETPGGQVDAAR